MQRSKIKPGVVYWYDPASTWREFSSGDAKPIVFQDVTTRWRRPSFSLAYHEHPTGKWMEATIAEGHGHGSERQTVFVLPAGVRGEIGWAKDQIEAARVKRRKVQDAISVQCQKAEGAAAQLHARLTALELPGHLEQPLSHRDGVRLNLTPAQANALVGILESVEAPFQAGYEEGQRDAEAERRRHLGYISVEEERERDARLASMGVAQRCPAGPGCSGAAFPGHPAHPQMGLPDDALPDADERALQRGLGS